MQIPVEFIQEGEYILAHTPALEVTTSGKTIEEAKANFREAVDLWVETCIEMGTLEKALKELGWQQEKIHGHTHLAPPKVIQRTEEPICIPA